MVKLATQQYKINVNYRYYIQRFGIIMLPLSHCLLLRALFFNALRPLKYTTKMQSSGERKSMGKSLTPYLRQFFKTAAPLQMLTCLVDACSYDISMGWSLYSGAAFGISEGIVTLLVMHQGVSVFFM